MYVGVLLLCVTGLCWAFVGVVVSHASRRNLDIGLIQLTGAALSIVISIAVLAFMRKLSFKIVDVPGNLDILIAVVCFAQGFVNYIGINFTGAAMRHGPHGIVWSTMQSAMMFPFLMGIVVFDVALTQSRLIGIALILTSVLLYGLGKAKVVSGSGVPCWKWYLPALLALCFCGAALCLGNLPSYWISPQNTVSSVYRSLFVALGTLASWFAVNTATGAIRRIRISSAGIKVTLLFAVSMLSVGLLNTYLFNYRGMDLLAQAGVGSIGMPIAVGVCVCGFFLYSLFFLRERLGKLQTFGFLAGVTGVVTICL